MNHARFVAIHGHFYQPPRENPWLERVETQDSAAPYHDWNARVTAECYAPNTAARRVDAQNRILDVADNFAAIAFDVGPTLLSWLARERPDVYHAIENEVDRYLLTEALRLARGNQVEASRLLGISRTTLRAKLDALGLSIEKQVQTNPNHVDQGLDSSK